MVSLWKIPSFSIISLWLTSFFRCLCATLAWVQVTFVLSYWACGPRFSHLTSGTPCTVTSRDFQGQFTPVRNKSPFGNFYLPALQPSKVFMTREDKPTQEALLDNPVLESPQSNKKFLPKMRYVCWWEDKVLCSHFFGTYTCLYNSEKIKKSW